MNDINWIQAVIITGATTVTAASLMLTHLTYPLAKYIIKYKHTTQQFQLGKIRKPHKLSALDIAGEGEYRLDLISGAALENTIREWGDIFNTQAQEKNLTGIHVSAVTRSLRITGWSLSHLQEESNTIKELVNSTNNLYFHSLKTLRQQAKEMEF